VFVLVPDLDVLAELVVHAVSGVVVKFAFVATSHDDWLTLDSFEALSGADLSFK